MEQFEQSLDMMRNGCAPKFKVNLEQLDALRNGYFDETIGSEIRVIISFLVVNSDIAIIL